MQHREREDPHADLDAMNYDELLEAKDKNLLDLAEIQNQIERAQAEVGISGSFSDRDWWRRVNAAKRFKGHRDQAISRRLSLEKAARHRASTFPEAFLEIARVQLDPDTFAHFKMLAEEELQDES